MQHIVHSPCSWHYRDGSSPGIYLEPVEDPSIRDIYVPTREIQPVSFHEARVGDQVISSSENLGSVRDAATEFNTQQPESSLNFAEVWENWGSRLPEGKFQVVEERGYHSNRSRRG